MLKLYTFFRSSAAYRVRIALNLKNLNYESIPIHLLKNGGEQNSPGYRKTNPHGLVPALQIEDGLVLTQSLAIIEYLEEAYPKSGHPLLPESIPARARVRALAQAIACDIHPLNNLRVLRYLVRELGAGQEQKDAWYRHWIAQGLQAIETELASSRDTGVFCHGDAPSLADCCLVPQVANAQRFDCPLDNFPTVMRIVAACEDLLAFQQAHPSNQADAE